MIGAMAQTTPGASRPAAFPVYGLDGAWSGARWLDSFGPAIGEEICWVRLAHQGATADSMLTDSMLTDSMLTDSMMMVETHSRPLTDAASARLGEPALQSVAFAAGVVLVNLTLPDGSVPRPPGLLQALVNQADQWSRKYAAWAPVSWQLDGETVAARAWWFAGGWAAFSDAVDGVYLAAVGAGGSPDGLTLGMVRDGRSYSFDLDRPLSPRVIAASSAAVAVLTTDEQRAARRLAWHADQLRVVGGQAGEAG